MRIGIFGGAFDPPHSEHINLILKSKELLRLDKIVLLLSYSPPHKRAGVSSFEIRKEMLLKAVEGISFVEIDEREKDFGGYGYSYKVLSTFAEEYPDDELIYIIGGDSMEKFSSWAHPEIISKLVTIAVAGRSGYKEVAAAVKHAEEAYGAEIMLMDYEGADVSSSVIKAEFALGERPENVCASVAEIIEKNGLYGNFKDLVDALKCEVTPDLFEHCAGTVIYAEKFTAKLNLDYGDVFIAALLHDCAKQKKIDAEKYSGVYSKVVHQFAGAELAESKYGIKKEGILDAIRFHTTGKRDMSALGKLIYCADVLERSRDYEGVDELRKLTEEDFEKGFRACVAASVKKLKNENKPVYYLTTECDSYYNGNKGDI